MGSHFELPACVDDCVLSTIEEETAGEEAAAQGLADGGEGGGID